MKEIAIVRFSPQEGPGTFADFIAQQGGKTHLIAVDEGDRLPEDPERYDGWCLMGGPMSVNDPLPWIPPLLSLLRRAVALGVPLIGHCLGGQLIAKALGGTVVRNPTKEIGWGEVWVTDREEGARWLGGSERFVAFHWHGETFSLPPGAKGWLASAHCANQAFAFGPHLALQCHVEMTEEMIHRWCAEWEKEGAAPSPAVQTPAEIIAAIPEFLPQLAETAATLYRAWWQGVLNR